MTFDLTMKIDKLDFSDTGNFSNIFLDYLADKPDLKPYYHRPPTLESFREQLKEKQLDPQTRNLLADTLLQQYQSLKPSQAVLDHIESLREANTYTVTTGHQLNIFTGPLYFIYKIVTVINLCRKLKETYPDYQFVPVYWMASEDHDFEEINHFNLFGKTYEWQTEQRGAVGRFHPNGIKDILKELPEPVPVFEQAYSAYPTLADATRCYVNELFGKEGLVVLDADHASLKASFLEVIKDDLINHPAKKLVEDTSEKLEGMGYKTQVYPREINFFYLQDQMRERIIQEKDQYYVNDTELKFSREALLSEVEKHPENFSPNVILRPLYQERLLPNLAYVGGPSEIAYWLQLKSVFDHYQLPFPILMPRNFALIINKTSHKKLQKTPVSLQDLFLDTPALTDKFLKDNAESTLTLVEEKKALKEVFEAVRQKVLAVDKGLDGFIGAEANKALKNLVHIEKRLKKAEEHNQETAIKQLESLKEKLFPGGSWQERKDNFLNFYINNSAFIEELLAHLDPLDFRVNVINEAM